MSEVFCLKTIDYMSQLLFAQQHFLVPCDVGPMPTPLARPYSQKQQEQYSCNKQTATKKHILYASSTSKFHSPLGAFRNCSFPINRNRSFETNKNRWPAFFFFGFYCVAFGEIKPMFGILKKIRKFFFIFWNYFLRSLVCLT